MTTPFIRHAGRNEVYDRAKQAIKRSAPTWFVKFVRSILSAPSAERNRRRLAKRFREKIGPQDARRLHLLLDEAVQCWREGTTDTAAAPIELPGPDGKEVWVRPRTPDIILYADVLMNEQYRSPDPRQRFFSIADCGANIGLSARYYMAMYPAARLLAIEPDPINLKLLKANLACISDRARIIEAAIWSSESSLSLRPEKAGTWASSVQPAVVPEPDNIRGLTIEALRTMADSGDVDLYKVDIEGAEVELLRSASEAWIRSLRCIQIELESPLALQLFAERFPSHSFALFRNGEVVTALRRSAS